MAENKLVKLPNGLLSHATLFEYVCVVKRVNCVCCVSSRIHSLDVHGNPLQTELMRDGRGPVVSQKDDMLKWSKTGLTTDELQQRLLALTDAQCATVTKCVVVCAVCGWRC